MTELLNKKNTATATTTRRTIYPVVNTMLIEFNLKLHHSQIHEFRHAVLSAISDSSQREVFSNERSENGNKKTIVRYPAVQYRVRNGHAAIWAMQHAVPLMHTFMQQYSPRFMWQGKHRPLALAQLPVETKDHTIKICRPPYPIYHLYYYLPFINDNQNRNYDWYKNSRNLPDTEKTKKLQELLKSHISNFIHYAGGYIPQQKIKLTILDKKMLDDVTFEGRPCPACEIRYTASLQLPDFISLGNKRSHGFGWQVQETE